MNSMTKRKDLFYGRAAAAVGFSLLWFAIWTVACNVLVIRHFHYQAFLWALFATTALSAAAAAYFSSWIIQKYADITWSDLDKSFSLFSPWLLVSFLIAGFTAAIAEHSWGLLPYLFGLLIATSCILLVQDRNFLAKNIPSPSESLGQVIVLFTLIIAVYFFSHRSDIDDANYINMAIGAQRTQGGVLELDTMLGDGPGLIILPTYKFHSFELLAAVLSTITNAEPITVFHLIIPGIEIVLMALALFLVFYRIVGSYWLAASILSIAFLFLNENTLGTWGIHGVIRLFEGKAFLITVIIPLIAALTARWFILGQWIDLVWLGIANICAVGFSANGLYGGPLASAFIALAFVGSAPMRIESWWRAIALIPTITYPAIAGASIVALKLAYPSEVLDPGTAINGLCFVAGYGLAGYAVFAFLALCGLGFRQKRMALAGALYIPIIMAVTLNPLSWRLINDFTGNLGFRVFWSIPAPVIAALVGLATLKSLGLRSERSLVLTSVAALVVAVAFNGFTSNGMTGIRWQWPDLKVNRDDYDAAKQLANKSPAGCQILAPEHISSWLVTIRTAPYPVFARELYLVHYRFTMPEPERQLRERLRLVVDGPASSAAPPPSELLETGIKIGVVAVDASAPSRGVAESLATSLKLQGPEHLGTLLVWSGRCT
jgi:hypothetical protein